ncbi:hypothetical protein FB45DRAFT_948131 [Roridomyces roridus]|uniref:Uncharacterized protein n=1 Tax=Roridomyces roridus TaxID=1738132 RepID=A0AAD7B1B6_9AGAR|nr:hypothetical protein FB45DRAFT_948131 [Roridomyces roridus]
MVLFIAKVLPLLALLATASLYPSRDNSLRLRTDQDPDDTPDPQFPASPATCGQCENHYSEIKLCMSLVPIMENTDPILSSPNSYISVITCACSDPFHSTFPQCVDCFESTGQADLLNMTSVNDVITGINKVCAFEHALFGGGATSSIPLIDEDDQTSTSSPPTSTPVSTPTSPAANTPTPTTPTPTSTTPASTAPSSTASDAALSHGPASGLLLGALFFVLGAAW